MNGLQTEVDKCKAEHGIWRNWLVIYCRFQKKELTKFGNNVNSIYECSVIL